MNYDELFAGTPAEMDSLEREERCRKTLKTINRAIFMRLLVTAVLIWAVLRSAMAPWALGLMALVLVINITGLVPLVTEAKKQRKLLKEIIAEDET